MRARLCEDSKLPWFIMVLVLMGQKYAQAESPEANSREEDEKAQRLEWHSSALKNVSAENLKEHLRNFTKTPHTPGSNESYEMALKMETLWKEYGIPFVEMKKYNVLLSEPESPGYFTIHEQGADTPIFTSLKEEVPLIDAQNVSHVPFPYNAYSPSGVVTGDLVYAYYGRTRDFKTLRDMKVNITGKIVIMRYAKGSRGAKVIRAQINGAAAAILYTDPEEYAVEGADKVFPQYNWLPSTGILRGNVKTTPWSGDPLTPGRPAVEGIYRLPLEDVVDVLPAIPVLPISYGDAEHLLKMMNNQTAGDEWKGALNVSYGVQSNNTKKVTLTVNNTLKMENIYNLIGTIRGSEEPDQIVIAGNHRDAWLFGATDGSSGTAAIMEVARVLGGLVQKGWRPRRTIVLASWGAEEPGTIGSTEWVEEYAKLLTARAVGYVNVDMAIDGNFTFRASATPLMEHVVIEATKKVYISDNETLYSDWISKARTENSAESKPKITGLGFASDHGPFYTYIGVPSLDIRYTYDKDGVGGIRNNVLYHTIHDTFYAVSTFLDPDFKRQQIVTQAWTQCILDLADSRIIPYYASNYTVAIEGFLKRIEDRFESKLTDNRVSLEPLKTVIEKYKLAAIEFDNYRANTTNISDVVSIRRINHRLLHLERSFINLEDPPVMVSRPQRRHVLLTRPPASRTPFLAGLVLSIREATKGRGTWEDVKAQMSLIVYAIQSATHTLNLKPI